MNKQNKAFTIIEVIIATGILTISVFGIYKLIAENNKIINNSNIYLSANLLVPLVENCIKNIDPPTGNKLFLDLGSDNKQCVSQNNETINNLDGIEYTMSFEGEDQAIGTIWSIEIFSDFTGSIESTFIQKK